jgi:FAD-binding domain/Ferric reductase like transmembrane component/Ferric reductase NAD binding domain
MIIARKKASALESFLLSHGVKFTLFALYIICNIIIFLHAAVGEQARHEGFQKYTTSIARGAGAIIHLNIAGVLLMASRSFISFLRDTPLALILPLDEFMPGFHTILGLIAGLGSVLHTLAHLPTYILKKNSAWSSGLHGSTSLFITGITLCILLALVCAAALPAVRRNHFEVFHGCHVWGSLVVYILLVIHGSHYGNPSSWKWILGPALVYCLDFAHRWHRERRSYLLINKHSAAIQGQYVLQLRLPRVFHFQAGQYAELKVPSISRTQWHPFTIASAPHESELVFYVKAAGNWTTELFQQFENSALTEDIAIHIRGPYGAPAQHVDQFEHLILVGGGVGATPFCSVFKSLENWITHWTPIGDMYAAASDPRSKIEVKEEVQPRRPDPVVLKSDAISARSNIRSENSFFTATMKTLSQPESLIERSVEGKLLEKHPRSIAADEKKTDDSENSNDSSIEQAGNFTRHDQKNRVLRSSSQQKDTRWDQLSRGSERPSISYWTALNSIYEGQHRAKTYHESLNLMLSMSYGSSSLARTILVKRARKNATARLDAVSATFEQDLSTFHDKTFIFLMYSKSVTFNLTLLWILIIRAVVAGASTIFNKFSPLQDGLAIYRSTGLGIIDLVLAFLIALGVGIPAAVECGEVGLAQMPGVDLFTLLPATLFSVIVDVLALAGVGRKVRLFGAFHVFVVWPIIAFLFILRLVRTIGERVALGESVRKTPCRTQSVGFYWTTPMHEDDHWLVGEVLPSAKAPFLRLHRYITRASPKADKWTQFESSSFQTYYGRPGWEDILNGIAEKSKNGTVIGLFVCGQKSMAADIENAAQSAMRNSIVRGLQNGSHPMRSLEEVFGETVSANLYTGDDVEGRGNSTHGCNIKIVFHKERFS